MNSKIDQRETEIYDKICRVIDSCKTSHHLDTTLNLIGNFKEIVSEGNSLMLINLYDRFMRTCGKLLRDNL